MTRKNIALLVTLGILSVLGGIVGGIVVRSYLLNSSFNVPLFGDINLGGQYQGGSLVISQPRNVIVEQDKRVAQVVADGHKSLVSVYKKKSDAASSGSGSTAVTNSLLTANYYNPAESLGAGLILTSDGWIITAVKTTAAAGVIVTYDGTVVALEQAIFDEISGYTFIKAQADNLVAAPFNEKQDVTDGQTLIGWDVRGVFLTTVAQARHNRGPAGVKSSEQAYTVISISQTDLAKGTPIVGLDGEVAGLHDSQGRVEPMYRYSQLLSGILREQKISRPFFGVNYLPLDNFAGGQKLTGALIAKNGQGVAVVKGSPAALAGLLEGDIIAAIDGIAVDTDNTLSDLIQRHASGEQIEVRIIRDGANQNLRATLTDME